MVRNEERWRKIGKIKKSWEQTMEVKERLWRFLELCRDLLKSAKIYGDL